MRLGNLSYAVIGVLVLNGTGLPRQAIAQTVAGPLAADDETPGPTVAKPRVAKPKSVPLKTKPAAKTKAAASDKPMAPGASGAPEPWAAVDPNRVAPRPANRHSPTDAEPVAARAEPADDAVSLGMKWNGSNTPNYGAATTSGLINEYNHDLGGASTGSGAEVGMKFKF